MLHLRPARRPPPRGDAGAATLESTGMYGLAALLVGAVVLVVLAAAPGIGDMARRAICMVVTLGQGDCGAAVTSAAAHVPLQPCVVQAEGHDTRVKGTFTFVSASTGEQWLVETLSDGRFRVVRGTTNSLGLEAGVGVTAQVVWDDKPYGVTASAGVAGDLGFRSGEVYYADDQGAVDDLLRQHGVDVAADNVLGDRGPVRDLADGLAGLVGLDDQQLPTPSETYVEGGLTLTGEARATFLYAGAKAGVGTATVLGVRTGRDGTTTEYIGSTVSGEVAAGVWAAADDGSTQYAQLKAQASVQQVVELERNADGDVTAVRTRIITAREAGATFGEEGPSTASYTERLIELPIRSQSDRQLAMRYMAAVGVEQVAGLAPGPLSVVAGVAAAGASSAFNQAARARGVVTEQTYDSDTSSYGGEFGVEAVAEASGGVTVNTMDRESTGGRYWDGVSWQPWRACG